MFLTRSRRGAVRPARPSWIAAEHARASGISRAVFTIRFRVLLALTLSSATLAGCVRLDTSYAEARAERAERLAGDPRTRPTPQEQRRARAMVEAQANHLTGGGAIRYRADGSASSPEKVRFVACPGALTLDFTALPSLNCRDGLPHAMTVAVYHLSDRAALDQIARTGEGIRRLLEGDRFDESVLSVRQLSVQPDSNGRLLVDRPENGRFVAVVAGHHEPDRVTSLYVTEYPLGRWSQKGESRLHWDQHMYMPLPLSLSATFREKDMQVRDTGLIYGDMRRVTDLTWDQMRYFTIAELGLGGD